MAPSRYDVMAAVTRYWDARAPHFDGVASHVQFEDAWRRVLGAAFGADGPRDVLDVGTGTGACALIAASLGHRVTAIDGSAGMLHVARQQALRRDLAIHFVRAVLGTRELTAGSFDIVTLRNVLWTLERPDWALGEVRRLLRPGGRVLIADGLWSAAPEGRSRYPAELVERLPLHPGITEDVARRMLSDHDFTSIAPWHQLFDSSPYPVGQPYFVLSAVAPT